MAKLKIVNLFGGVDVPDGTVVGRCRVGHELQPEVKR